MSSGDKEMVVEARGVFVPGTTLDEVFAMLLLDSKKDGDAVQKLVCEIFPRVVSQETLGVVREHPKTKEKMLQLKIVFSGSGWEGITGALIEKLTQVETESMVKLVPGRMIVINNINKSHQNMFKTHTHTEITVHPEEDGVVRFESKLTFTSVAIPGMILGPLWKKLAEVFSQEAPGLAASVETFRAKRASVGK
jgi:hypothetical protein